MKDKDFERYLKSQGYTESSRASYEHAVQVFTEWTASRKIDCEYVTYSELLDYLKHLKQRSLHMRTVQGYLIGITHYFAF